jgi:hypothetical protein
MNPECRYMVCKVESAPGSKKALISVIDARTVKLEEQASDLTLRFIPISIQTYKRLGLNVGELITLKSSKISRVPS